MMLINHEAEQVKVQIKPRIRQDREPETKVNRKPEIKTRREKEVIIGQGEGVTRWKGCLCIGLG